MKITLDVKDNRLKTFKDFIDMLDYISVNQEDILFCKQNEVGKRLDFINKGDMKTRSWNGAKKEIIKV